MQNSFTEENYLKIIHALSGRDGIEVSTNALAESTSTRAASVTDMLRKLAEKGLIHYKKYQGVTLTESGEKVAIKVIRKHPRTQAMPFIMATGRSDKEQVKEAISFGVNNYIIKPFDASTMKKRIEAVIGALT